MLRFALQGDLAALDVCDHAGEGVLLVADRYAVCRRARGGACVGDRHAHACGAEHGDVVIVVADGDRPPVRFLFLPPSGREGDRLRWKEPAQTASIEKRRLRLLPPCLTFVRHPPSRRGASKSVRLSVVFPQGNPLQRHQYIRIHRENWC